MLSPSMTDLCRVASRIAIMMEPPIPDDLQRRGISDWSELEHAVGNTLSRLKGIEDVIMLGEAGGEPFTTLYNAYTISVLYNYDGSEYMIDVTVPGDSNIIYQESDLDLDKAAKAVTNEIRKLINEGHASAMTIKDAIHQGTFESELQRKIDQTTYEFGGLNIKIIGVGSIDSDTGYVELDGGGMSKPWKVIFEYDGGLEDYLGDIMYALPDDVEEFENEMVNSQRFYSIPGEPYILPGRF